MKSIKKRSRGSRVPSRTTRQQLEQRYSAAQYHFATSESTRARAPSRHLHTLLGAHAPRVLTELPSESAASREESPVRSRRIHQSSVHIRILQVEWKRWQVCSMIKWLNWSIDHKRRDLPVRRRSCHALSPASASNKEAKFLVYGSSILHLTVARINQFITGSAVWH